ncbi:MAG: hypothetical protein Q7R22_012105 [Verrucomicrobiota bacterium JB025]|nr:hypothetical protein [Verrucomicrobiota bacterium JB025]
MIRLLSTTLLLLLHLPIHGEDKPGGYVDPWLGRHLRDTVNTATWKGGRQEPLQLLEFRTLDLDGPTIRSARLANGRAIALLAADRKTINLVDLAREKVRNTVTEDEAITTLIGHGTSLLAYLPATKSIVLRDLRRLDEKSVWSSSSDLLAMGVAGGSSLEHIVVVDRSLQAWWLHPANLEPRHGPVALTELAEHLRIASPRSALHPLRSIAVHDDGSFLIKYNASDTSLVSAPGRGRQKMTPVENPSNFPWNYADQLPHIRQQRLGNGELVPIDKHNIASLVPHSAKTRIAIRDASTGIPWLELNGLPSCENNSFPGNGPRPFPHTAAERLFFDSYSGKFALLDTNKNTLHFCDLKLNQHAKSIPRLQGPNIHYASGTKASASPRFDRSKLISAFSVRKNRDHTSVDPRTGVVRVSKPTHSGRNPSREVEVICELSNGRKLATVHHFRWTASE